jgi:hypothetical protein
MAGRAVSQGECRRLRWLCLIPGSFDLEPSHLSTGWSTNAMSLLAHARRHAHLGLWLGDMSVIICLFLVVVGCDDSSQGESPEDRSRYPFRPARVRGPSTRS